MEEEGGKCRQIRLKPTWCKDSYLFLPKKLSFPAPTAALAFRAEGLHL